MVVVQLVLVAAYDFVLMNFFLSILLSIFMHVYSYKNQLKRPMQKKRIGIYVHSVSNTHSHAIEMRCKQSDIFAKFMYLRHRVILSHFGEMYSRTHTHTRTHAFHMRNISIKHIETTIRTRGYAKRGPEKNTHHREKIFDVKPTNKKFVSV